MPQYIKRKTHDGQLGFIQGIQGCFNLQKAVNAFLHINRLIKKKYIIIPIDAGKISDKIQNPFMVKI